MLDEVAEDVGVDLGDHAVGIELDPRLDPLGVKQRRTRRGDDGDEAEQQTMSRHDLRLLSTVTRPAPGWGGDAGRMSWVEADDCLSQPSRSCQ